MTDQTVEGTDQEVVEVTEDNIEQVKKTIKLPPAEATGSLTVEEREALEEKPDVLVVGDGSEKAAEVLEVIAKESEEPVKVANTDKKELPPLPKMGTKFMIEGHEYKVVWLNPGKNRFSAEPCKGVY